MTDSKGDIDVGSSRGVPIGPRPGSSAEQETPCADAAGAMIEEVACVVRVLAARELILKVTVHQRTALLAHSQEGRRQELEIEPARFRFEPDGGHVREVYYGGLFILIQHYNDPTIAWEQQRALTTAMSVLRHRW